MNIQNDTDGKGHPDQNSPPQWKGLAEIDRAIADNRLTEYRLRKSWSDPLARRLGIAIAFMFAGFAAFVIIQDVL